MAWILVPSLVSLRNEFNALSPVRDRASDGAIGDGEHSQNTSDHNPDETGKTGTEDADSINEVHAIDVDADLHRPGWTMLKAVEIIVARHRDGRDDRLQNVIYNRRIWSRSWGWTARTYTGKNDHAHHAHFGARYTTAQENDTRPWGLLELLEDEMALSDQDKAWMEKTIDERVKAGTRAAVVAVLADGYTAAVGGASARTAADKSKRNIRDYLRAIVGGPTEDDIEAAKAAILDELDDQPQA